MLQKLPLELAIFLTELDWQDQGFLPELAFLKKTISKKSKNVILRDLLQIIGLNFRLFHKKAKKDPCFSIYRRKNWLKNYNDLLNKPYF